jgi:hypothetical protein
VETPQHYRREALAKIHELLRVRGQDAASSAAFAHGEARPRSFIAEPLDLWIDATGSMISVTFAGEIVVAHQAGRPMHWIDGPWEDALDAAYRGAGLAREAPTALSA